MPAKLSKSQTVTLQVKVPLSMKKRMRVMTRAEGTENVSDWLRRLIYREARAREVK
jgi:hypothetical protein